MTTAKLEDILSGEVETNTIDQHFEIRDGDTIVCRSYGPSGIDAEIDRLFRGPRNKELQRLFWDSWPASCAWVVEWEEKESTNDDS